MAHVVVIGNTGHVGTYLVPRLAEAGYEVTAVSRGARDPYQPRYTSFQAVYEAVTWLIEKGVVKP